MRRVNRVESPYLKCLVAADGGDASDGEPDQDRYTDPNGGGQPHIKGVTRGVEGELGTHQGVAHIWNHQLVG